MPLLNLLSVDKGAPNKLIAFDLRQALPSMLPEYQIIEGW